MFLPFDIPQELADELTDTRILTLVTGTLRDGSAHYAYASIPLARYMDFKLAESRGGYRLEDYGEVVAHGEGLEPPAEMRRRMEEERGANHLFEEELTKLLDQMQAGNR